MKKIARPDMAPQNFNSRSLTFNHVLYDVSHVANTTTIYDSRDNRVDTSSSHVITVRGYAAWGFGFYARLLYWITGQRFKCDILIGQLLPHFVNRVNQTQSIILTDVGYLSYRCGNMLFGVFNQITLTQTEFQTWTVIVVPFFFLKIIPHLTPTSNTVSFSESSWDPFLVAKFLMESYSRMHA
jgi:hypothetical protein